VSASTLCRDTDCLHWGILWFYSVPLDCTCN
jgi:hypothetical protein